MNHVHIICEGTTESGFAKAVLAPHLALKGIMLHPARIGRIGQKGGNITFDRLRRDIGARLTSHREAYCTTFIDFYGLPQDFPGKREAARFVSLEDKQAAVCGELENQLREAIGENVMRRFIPYVQMHEFEALLFCDTGALASVIGVSDADGKLEAVRIAFATPEHIDDSPDTAPSKRILDIDPQYRKPVSGLQAALEIGLPSMRDQCPLFRAWLRSLESLA